VIDGMLNSRAVNINLQVPTCSSNITLQPPPERFRIAQIFIDFFRPRRRDLRVG